MKIWTEGRFTKLLISTLQHCQGDEKQDKTNNLSQIRGDKSDMGTKYNVVCELDPRREKRTLLENLGNLNKDKSLVNSNVPMLIS